MGNLPSAIHLLNYLNWVNIIWKVCKVYRSVKFLTHNPVEIPLSIWVHYLGAFPFVFSLNTLLVSLGQHLFPHPLLCDCIIHFFVCHNQHSFLGSLHTIKFTLCALRFYRFWQMLHYNSIQNSFTTLKVPCDIPFSPSFPVPNPWAITDHFVVSMVLSFTGWHIIGMIKYVAFSD